MSACSLRKQLPVSKPQPFGGYSSWRDCAQSSHSLFLFPPRYTALPFTQFVSPTAVALDSHSAAPPAVTPPPPVTCTLEVRDSVGSKYHQQRSHAAGRSAALNKRENTRSARLACSEMQDNTEFWQNKKGIAIFLQGQQTRSPPRKRGSHHTPPLLKERFITRERHY